jgi:predicted transposase YdaD
VLSRLRKLNVETQKELNTMALTYNIEDDVFYQQGIEKGIAEGIEKGIEKIIAIMLQKKHLKLEEIADLADVSVDFVKKVQENLKKKK